jgi:predicted DNA-binding ribbon-helix-helix protein
VFSIQKVDDQLVATGIATEIKMDNIFWCESDQIAVAKDNDSSTCLVCDSEMTNIGWVESNDVAKNQEIGKAIDRHVNKDSLSGNNPEEMPEPTITKQADNETNIEGGAVKNMEIEKSEEVTEIQETTEEVVEKGAVVAEEATEAVEAVAEETSPEDEEGEDLEKAANSDVEVEEPDFVKMLEDLKTFFGENISKSAEETKVTVEEITKTIDAQITELAEKHENLSKAVENIKSAIDTIEKRVDLVESETAVKKSGDLDGSKEETTIRKSIWSGSFLAARDL